MDYESLRQAMNTPQGTYALMGAASLLSFLAGYAIKSVFSRGNEAKIAQAQRDNIKYEFKMKRIEDAEGRLNRKILLLKKKREYALEDEDRDDAKKRERRQEKHDRRLQAARELVGLKDTLQGYLAQQPEDARDTEQRDAYRKKITDEILNNINEDEERTGGVAGRFARGGEVIDERDVERIERIVKLKFPIKEQRKIPKHLRRLMHLVLED